MTDVLPTLEQADHKIAQGKMAIDAERHSSAEARKAIEELSRLSKRTIRELEDLEEQEEAKAKSQAPTGVFDENLLRDRVSRLESFADRARDMVHNDRFENRITEATQKTIIDAHTILSALKRELRAS